MDENGRQPRGSEDRGAEHGLNGEQRTEGLRKLFADESALAETLEFLSPYARGLVNRALAGEISEAEFLREVFVGDCPNCESTCTVDCQDVTDIEDVAVGLCHDCGYTWCLECGAQVERGEPCGHWEICGGCDEEKDEFGECGIPAFDCPLVVAWIAGSSGPGLEVPGCAWCGACMACEGEVFAIGARIEKGVGFTGANGTGSPLLPVVVAGRIIPAVVTSCDSQAKLEGNDIMFMVCGEGCAKALRGALIEEKSLHDRIKLN